MECKKCGWVSKTDDVVFCGNCGTRIDGKKECPACKKFNDEDVNFCVYCGHRVDGKTVCRTCGTVFEGNFCSKCGTKSNAVKKEKPVQSAVVFQNDEEVPSVSEKAKKVIDVVALSSIAFAVLFALIFVFFIGVEGFSTVSGQIYETDPINIFDYFGEYYKDLKQFDLSTTGTVWAQTFTHHQYVVKGVVGTLIGALSILCTYVFAVVCLISYVRSRSIEKAGKWALACVFAFVVGTVCFYSAERMSVAMIADKGGVQGLKNNGATQAGLILSLIFVGIYLVCGLIKKGKSLFTANSLISVGCTLGALLFVGLSFGFAKEIAVSFSHDDFGSLNFSFLNTNVTASTLFLPASELLERDVYLKATREIDFMTLFAMVAQICIFAVAIISACKVVAQARNFHEEKNHSGIVFAALGFIAAIAVLVFQLCSYNHLQKLLEVLDASSEGVSSVDVNLVMPILTIVFSLIGLATSIVQLVVKKKKSQQIIEEESI